MSNRPYDASQFHAHTRGNPGPHPGNSRSVAPQFFNPPPNRIVVHDHDVLSGRGVNIAHHPGNERFRSLITTYQDQSFCTSYSASEKKAIAREIVDHILNLDPPGRFLKREGRGQVARGLSGPWELLSERDAMKKTCQALRDCNRTDRTGYADGVSAPGDVVEKVKKLSSQGMSTKDRAAEAAAKTAAEAAKAASSETLKRRREDSLPPSFAQNHPLPPRGVRPSLHQTLTHSQAVFPQLLPMNVSVAGLNGFPHTIPRQAIPQHQQAQHPSYMSHLAYHTQYNPYTSAVTGPAAHEPTAHQAFSQLQSHAGFYDTNGTTQSLAEILSLPIYDRGNSPPEIADQVFTTIKKQRTEDTEPSSEPSSSNTSTPLNATSTSIAERIDHNANSASFPALSVGIEGDPNLFRIKELDDDNENTSNGWDDGGNSASMDHTEQFTF